MRPADPAALLAAVVIGIGLVGTDLPLGWRLVAVVGASIAFGRRADRSRLPLALAAVLVAAVVAPSIDLTTVELPLVGVVPTVNGVVLVVIAAGLGGVLESASPPMSGRTPGSDDRRMGDGDVVVLDRELLHDLVAKEIGRAQRLDHELVVVATAPASSLVPSIAASLRQVLRLYDTVGYDTDAGELVVVAVVPTAEARRAVTAKIGARIDNAGPAAGTGSIPEIDVRSYPVDGVTAGELLAGTGGGDGSVRDSNGRAA